MNDRTIRTALPKLVSPGEHTEEAVRQTGREHTTTNVALAWFIKELCQQAVIARKAELAQGERLDASIKVLWPSMRPGRKQPTAEKLVLLQRFWRIHLLRAGAALPPNWWRTRYGAWP